MVNNFDPQNVIQSVWGTKAISVQLTDQVGWNSLRIFGYIVGGKRCIYFCFFSTSFSSVQIVTQQWWFFIDQLIILCYHLANFF